VTMETSVDELLEALRFAVCGCNKYFRR